MKREILKISIVCMLLVTLTAINFLTVGVGLVSYAMESSVEMAKTNNENIGFSAYLKNERGEKISNASVDINASEMKLYLNLEVAKEGYFNGIVKLNNANFEFVSSQSEFVNEVTSDTIKLNQINAGSSPEIEVTIKPKIEENFNLDLLNMNNEIKLEGVYKNRTEKDKKIEGTDEVQIAYANGESKAINTLEVLTNKVGVYDGEEKRIVQVLLKLGMENNSYPVKHITSQINVPTIEGETPKVEAKFNLKEMTKSNYNVQNDIVAIDIENEANANNQIEWKKAGAEEVVLTYIYDKDTVINYDQITSKEKIMLHNGTEVTAEDSSVTINNDEIKDEIIKINAEVEPSIYKGKIYAGVEKEYRTQTQIQVNLDKVVETLYVNENATSVPTTYKNTIINKKELMNLLGENGSLEISTTTERGKKGIMTVTKTTEEDENGNVVIEYPEGVDSIRIRTTRPQNAGNLTINHTKKINPADVEAIKNATEIVATFDGTYNTSSSQKGSINKIEAKTQLQETVTDAKLEVSRDSLSTVTVNKNVQLRATLKSNAEQYDLYKNPTIEIEYPEDVTGVKVNSINKIYGEEFEQIEPSQAVVNGRQVVKVKLGGVQTAYKEQAIEGTQIIIDADLTLNNRATNKEEAFKMTYTNEIANQYKEGAPVGTETLNVNVVSPKGLITVNNMNALGIETIGEQEEVTKTLDMATEAKLVKVESEIINNDEAQVNNVAILGNFATDSEQNNLHATLKSGITLEGIDTSRAKIYYTENENATAEITNPENNWQENVTASAKKYLVTIDNMQVAEGMKASYDMEVPANLEYNQKATQGYAVDYIQSETGASQQVKATSIELATEELKEVKEEEKTEEIAKQENAQQGDIEVRVEHDVQSGDNGVIEVGTNTSYIATIKNLTDKEQKDIKFKWNMPEDVKILSHFAMNEETYNNFLNPEYSDESGIKTLENNKEVTIDSIPANSSVVIYVLIEANGINEDISKGFKISATATVGDKTYNSNDVNGEIKNNTQFTATLKANKENEFIKAGEEIDYTIKAKNNNDIVMNGLLIEDKIPDGLSVKNITVGNQEIEVPTSNELAIPVDFQPGEEKEIKIKTMVDYKTSVSEEEKITNKATLIVNQNLEKTTNEVSHEILATANGGNQGNKVINSDGSISYTYKINGTAWEDENRNGQRDENEGTLKGINVRLLNVETNQLATTPQGESITASTGDDGRYTLDRVPEGNYIAIFDYDTSEYTVTDYKKEGVDANRNSNVVAKKASIDGTEKTYAVTDTIAVKESNISNINIGLAKSQQFDMKLEKFVSKVVLQDSKNTRTYDYNDETLAKVEIKAKNVEDTTAIIEYKIRVTNAGELEGYVKNIVDYLPNDLTFSSELNEDWYQQGNALHSASLENIKLAPGESREITLTATKKMTKDNTGLINNQAEIAADYNGSGVSDINSTPGNKKQGENDIGSADVIISINTGESMFYVTLVIIGIVVLSAAVFFIKREINMKEII